MKLPIVIVSIVLMSIGLHSCYYDVEEELYPVGCEVPVTSLYTTDVAPLISQHCLPCHSADNASGGIVLDSYAAIEPYATGTILSCVINHGDDCSAMPDNSPKISDCEIETIDNWIADGAQNN